MSNARRIRVRADARGPVCPLCDDHQVRPVSRVEFERLCEANSRRVDWDRLAGFEVASFAWCYGCGWGGALGYVCPLV